MKLIFLGPPGAGKRAGAGGAEEGLGRPALVAAAGCVCPGWTTAQPDLGG